MTPLPTHIHMVGAGGMGMAPLGLYLQQTGIRVSAEDDAFSPKVAELLEANGVQVVSGKAAARMRGRAPMLVWSSAVRECDTRLEEARTRGAQVIRRGALLARVVKGRRLLAVVGSHGKTTTAAMLVHALRKKRFSFDYIVGGFFRDESRLPAGYMGAQWVIAEVDESDGTIEDFEPALTLALNFDWDHPDHYPSEDALRKTLGALFERTKECILISDTSEVLAELASGASVPARTFGEDAHFCAEYAGGSLEHCELELSGALGQGCVRVGAGGGFNAHNATAALAAVHVLCSEVEGALLDDFSGIARRQDKLFEDDSLQVFADYAHHPAELEALLEHVKEHEQGKLAVVFQPHRYSRTRQYAADFARVLAVADALCLLPVYAASEVFDEHGTSAVIAAQMGDSQAVVAEDFAQMVAYLKQTLPECRTLLFLGAGDVEQWARRYVDELLAPKTAGQGGDWFASLEGQVSEGTVLSRGERLARKSTLRVGGEARWYAQPASVADLQAILRAAHGAGVTVFFLGRGSNLLIADEGFDGLVIHLHGEPWRGITQLDDERLEVGAGVRLQGLSAKACKWGMAGFEFLEGIPGSLGGALRMNAGAMGGWMFDVVESVEFVTLEGQLHHLSKDAFTVGYRHCLELKNAVATRAVLRAPELSDEPEIRQKMQDFSEHRVTSQPREPSAGCMFKNPEGDHAGKLVDELGLKGYRVGQAEISTVHGNFIINHGGATCADVIEIMRHVRATVRKERDLELEPEVMLIGKNWEDVL